MCRRILEVPCTDNKLPCATCDLILSLYRTAELLFPFPIRLPGRRHRHPWGVQTALTSKLEKYAQEPHEPRLRTGNHKSTPPPVPAARGPSLTPFLSHLLRNPQARRLPFWPHLSDGINLYLREGTQQPRPTLLNFDSTTRATNIPR
ncbi:hypothetical protein BDZ85DRAFT_113699 [Elsinoe ampelina]|uniref:Uncharacterized protein n=1 Tax=Elsinoe ampelina TaxID=302913 RepID=A0A6A6GDE8_9PEZI|nr:hypothetical protein BDZ85DRAFT_113699 [Elsinoe ampelina]